MVTAPSAAAAALSMAFGGMMLFLFVGPQSVPGTSTSAPSSTPNLNGVLQILQILLLLSLFIGVAFLHRRLYPAAAAAAGASTELAALVVCTAVSLLEFIFFVLQPAGVVVADVGKLARALGAAAADALPASATVTFYLGITLVIAHIRAGGEGGGTGAVANHRRVVPVPVDILKKLALAAAGALFIQMGVAIYFNK